MRFQTLDHKICRKTEGRAENVLKLSCSEMAGPFSLPLGDEFTVHNSVNAVGNNRLFLGGTVDVMHLIWA